MSAQKGDGASSTTPDVTVERQGSNEKLTPEQEKAREQQRKREIIEHNMMQRSMKMRLQRRGDIPECRSVDGSIAGSDSELPQDEWLNDLIKPQKSPWKRTADFFWCYKFHFITAAVLTGTAVYFTMKRLRVAKPVK